MLAQLMSVALTVSVKATDTKSVSSFNHFLSLLLGPSPELSKASAMTFMSQTKYISE